MFVRLPKCASRREKELEGFLGACIVISIHCCPAGHETLPVLASPRGGDPWASAAADESCGQDWRGKLCRCCHRAVDKLRQQSGKVSEL